MKWFIRKEVILAVGIVVIMATTGCEETNLSNIKKHRLIAAENLELKKKLGQCDKELEQQKKLLEEYMQGEKALEGQSQKGIQDVMDSFLKDIAEENAKLHEENEKLKAQIIQLEAELKELKKEPTLEPL